MKPPRIFEKSVVAGIFIGLISVFCIAATGVINLRLDSDMDANGFAIEGIAVSTNATSVISRGWASTNLATFAQGDLADTALQPSGNGSALTGLHKSQVGLGDADDTSDLDKPISTATQTALDGKGVKLVEVSGTAARLALTGTSVNVGDLVKEIGQAEQAATFIVSGGAGTAANGTYTESGTENGRPKYVFGDYRIAFLGGYGWRLYYLTTPYYDEEYGPDDNTPATVFGWIDTPDGSYPAPAVTAGLPYVAGITATNDIYMVIDTAELDNSAGWLKLTP